MAMSWRDLPPALRKQLIEADPTIRATLRAQPKRPPTTAKTHRPRPFRLHGPDTAPRPLPEPGPGVYRVVVPNWRPATLDDIYARTIKRRIATKRNDRDLIAYYFGPHGADVPKATTRRRVWMEIQRPRGCFPDPDNLWKSLLDALAILDYLIDDAKEAYAKEEPIYKRGPVFQTTIVLEDM